MAPLKDVIHVDKSGVHDCKHSLSLFHPYGADYVFVLDLFSCLDYVGTIIIDRPPFLGYCGYQYDLIDADVVLEEFRWLAHELQISQWLNAREIPYDRMISRAHVLQYWFTHRPEIWMRRGLRAANAALDRGLSEGEAEKIAITEIRKRMAARKWEVDSVQLTINKVA